MPPRFMFFLNWNWCTKANDMIILNNGTIIEARGLKLSLTSMFSSVTVLEKG